MNSTFRHRVASFTPFAKSTSLTGVVRVAATILALACIAPGPEAVAQETSILHLKHGDDAPEIRLDNLDGQTIDLKTADNAAEIVIFGNVMQDRTRQAVENTINAIDGESRILPGDRKSIRIVLVNASDWTADRVRTTIVENWKCSPDVVLLDPDRTVFGRYGVTALPSMVVIGRDGRLIHVVAGLMPEFAEQATLSALYGLGKVSDEELERALVHAQAPTPEDENVRRANRHVQLAGRLAARGMQEAAITEYAKALEITPDLPDAHVRLARLLVLQGRLDDAERHFEDTRKLDPESTDAMMGLAWIALKRGVSDTRRLDEIESDLRDALIRPNRRSQAFYLLGLVFEQRGDWEQAAINYRRSAERMLERTLQQEDE